MKSTPLPCGDWKGFHLRAEVKAHMELELHVRGFRVYGTGKDGDGRFEIDGVYEPVPRRLEFEKRYRQGSHTFRGVYDGARVTGEWYEANDPSAAKGAFMIWPVA